jgi:hypothetical protein
MFMALWTGDCGSLTLVPNSCSDPESEQVTGLTPGTTYYLQVYTYTGEGGQTSAFDACIGTLPPPPANDDCAGAYPMEVNPDLDCGSLTAGTVAGATDSGVTTDCSGTPDDDVWFSFTATYTDHTISLDDVTGSTDDMYMALWSGDCGNLTLVPNTCSDPESMDVTDLLPGTTYYLQVYTWTSDAGQSSAFNVCVGTEPQTVGIAEDPASHGISVYPDPATTELFITTRNGKPVQVKVYDMVGNMVMEQDVSDRLDISGLAPGSYILFAVDGKGEDPMHVRFMKN